MTAATVTRDRSPVPRTRVQHALWQSRLTLRIVGLTLRAQAEYRVEFALNIVIGIVWQISVIVFATVLLTRFSGMGAWRSQDVLLMAATRMLAHGLYVLVFGRVFYLAYLVQEGVIDAFLLRPLPVYRQVQLVLFPTNAIGDLTVAVLLMLGAISRSHLHWTAGSVAYLVAGVVGGMLMESAVFTALSSAALHFPATSYWSNWTEELLATFGSYPLSILPRGVGLAFTFVMPVAFVAYFPVAVLTGHTAGLGVPAWLATASPVVGLAAFLAARLLWNRSLRHYAGVNG